MTRDLIYKIMTSNYGEFAMNLTRGQAPCESGEKNEITARSRRDYGSCPTRLRLVVSLLLLMLVGVNTVWGQTTDYSGVYYIANDNSASGSDDTTPYSDASDAQKYYLVPAANPQKGNNIDAYYSPNHAETDGAPAKPFLTTFHTNKDINSIWIVKKTGSYYYVIHAVTGKYAIYEVPLPNDPNTNTDPNKDKNGKRKTMHLQVPDDEEGTGTYRLSTNNNYQFTITLSDGIYRFQPSNRSGWYWNPANGNKNKYYGQSSGNNDLQRSIYYAGLVGVYNNLNDGGSKWHFENAKLPAPTIEYDTDSGTFTITYDKISPGFEILYTMDGSEPTIGGSTTSTFNGTPVSLADGETVKAVVTRYGMILTETAHSKLVLNPTITLAQNEYTYTGSAITPAISSVMDGETPIDASDYTVSYNNNINAGNSATVNIVDKEGGDYIVYGSTTFTINPANVTLTANSDTKAYDGTEKTINGFTCSLEGLTFAGVTASGSGTNIGNYPVTFTGVTIGTTKDTSGNYVVSETVNGTLTITPKPLTITADSDTKVYDGTALTKNSYTSEGLMAGDVIESVTITGSQTEAGSSDNVPSAAIVKKGNEVVTDNYNIIYNNGTLTITPKTLTVTAEAKSKAYGEADPALTYTSVGLINDDAITGALTRDAGENAGDYAILQGTLTAGNNYAISYTAANLTITKVGLTITANNNTITYGEAPAGNGVTYEGLVNNETGSVLSGTLAYDYNYTQYGEVGNTYTITPKGVTSSNYDITFADGILTVNPKEVGLTWSETTSFPYDGSPHAPTVSATGKVNDDAITVTVTGAQTNAGEHTATASALTGDKAGNYVLPEEKTKTFTITSKSIGNGTTLADGYTLDFGEGNTILLTDDAIGSTLVASTDYTVGDDTSDSDKYSQRTVTGAGNYSGSVNVRNAKVSLTTDASEEGWSATFTAEAADPSDIGHALPKGVMAFIITGIRGEWAIPEPLTYIPAGVPVLLVASKKLNGFIPMDAESGEVTPVTDAQKGNNMLEEVTETTTGYDAGTQSAPFTTKQIYLLYNNEFVFNKAGNLKKGKIYLNPSHTAPANSNPAPARLRIAWSQATGIQNLQDDRTISIEDGVWYTIDGRRLNGKPSAKGLYIVDGKKTVVK